MPDRDIALTLDFGTSVIYINKTATNRLVSVSGLEGAEYDLRYEEYADSDGGFVKNERYAPRDIRIVFQIASWSLQEDLRQQLIGQIRPEREGVLTADRNGLTRHIVFRVTGRPEFSQSNLYTARTTVTVNLVCMNPWMYGDQVVNEFRSVAPLFTLPLIMYPAAGVASGLVAAGNVASIVNDGERATGFVLTLTASGTVVNPTITHSTGAYIAILRTLADGDAVTVSTNPGQKYIKLNGVNAMVYDRNSTFFQLPTGQSNVTVSAASGVSNLSKSLSYYPKYRGI